MEGSGSGLLEIPVVDVYGGNHEVSRPQDWREGKAFFPVGSCNESELLGHAVCSVSRRSAPEMAGPVTNKSCLRARASTLGCEHTQMLSF
jgi:hypothetical protein